MHSCAPGPRTGPASCFCILQTVLAFQFLSLGRFWGSLTRMSGGCVSCCSLASVPASSYSLTFTQAGVRTHPHTLYSTPPPISTCATALLLADVPSKWPKTQLQNPTHNHLACPCALPPPPPGAVRDPATPRWPHAHEQGMHSVFSQYIGCSMVQGWP